MSDSRRRILLVDDDADLRVSLSEALAEAGFEVTTAENGQQALDLLQASLPDLVLLDLLMPVMNGWQFCRALKEAPRTAGIPVIAMSAAVSKDPHSPYYVEVDDFVAKPLELDDLVGKIAAVLGRVGRPPGGGIPQRL